MFLKDHLDVHVRPTKASQRFANTTEGIAAMVVWIKPRGRANRLGIDRTLPESRRRSSAGRGLRPSSSTRPGPRFRQGHELSGQDRRHRRRRHRSLRQSRYHQGATPGNPKFAIFVAPLRPPRSTRPHVDRRENQRHSATVAQASDKVIKSIDKHIHYLEGQIEDLENRMDAIIQLGHLPGATDPAIDHRYRSPRFHVPCSPSCPGWGGSSSSIPTALVGLAPFNDDGGSASGQRHIRGGRSKVGYPVGDRGHPALSAHESVLRRAQSPWQGSACRDHRRRPEDPGAGQRNDPRHGALQNHSKLRLLKDLDSAYSYASR